MRKHALFIFVFICTFSGCSLIYSIFFKEPEILGIDKISIHNINKSGAIIDVKLSVLNENDEDINILKCQYILFVNDALIGKGINNKKQVLKGNDTSYIIMPLEIKVSDLTNSALMIYNDILNGKELIYRVEGKVTGESQGVEVDVQIKLKKKLISDIL